MLSGSAEPDCCGHLPLRSPTPGSAVNRADAPLSDAPGAMATKFAAHATIQQTVFAAATTAFRAGSTAVN